jgi:ABC-type Na+ efflux pump permease subunit
VPIAAIIWPGGSTTPPLDSLPLIETSRSVGLVDTIYAITAICMTITCVIIAIIIVHRKKTVLRLSAPSFLVAFLIGALLIYAFIIMLGLHPTDDLCAAQPYVTQSIPDIYEAGCADMRCAYV